MKIESGRIVKAQGIKGEVKVACMLDSPTQFHSIAKVYVGEEQYAIESVRILTDSFAILKLGGVDDRNTAESLVNAHLLVNREDVRLNDGRYLIDELIGCTVLLTGDVVLGTLVTIAQGKSADVYTCRTADNSFVSFPFVSDLLLEVDIAKKRILICEKRFREVCLYAD